MPKHLCVIRHGFDVSSGYRKNPQIQRRLDALRYRTAVPPPVNSSTQEVYERPVYPYKRVKHATMTLEEIDEATPSLSIQTTNPPPVERTNSPISKLRPAVTAPPKSYESDSPPKVEPMTAPASLPTYSSIELTCPICVDTITNTHFARQIEACRHVFHADCLIRWLSSYQANCPLCKRELHSLKVLGSAAV